MTAIEASIFFKLSPMDELILLLEKIINITKANSRINEYIRAEAAKDNWFVAIGITRKST